MKRKTVARDKIPRNRIAFFFTVAARPKASDITASTPLTDDDQMIYDFSFLSTLKSPQPAANEPGSLSEQFRTIVCAIRLGDAKATSAAKEWQTARRMVLPHAKGGSK